MQTSVTNEKEDRLYSIEDAANRLSLSAWTLRKWITEKRINSCKLGSRRLIAASEIQRIIQNSRQDQDSCYEEDNSCNV